MLFFLFTVIVMTISFFSNREKTYFGIKKGFKMFYGIFPDLLFILLATSLMLGFIPEQTIIKYLGDSSGVFGILIVAVIGSVALIPAFIAFPLAAFVMKAGVSIKLLAVFITTLMMVGVITFPLECRYFGFKAAFLRNFFSFIAAILIGLTIGLVL